jgi:von Willebrand factor type A domain
VATEQDTKRIKPGELLKMLDLEERKTLALECDLIPPRNLKDRTFSKNISSFSVTTLLRSIVRIRSPVIHMLQEVHQFLDQEEASGRANSHAVVLTGARDDLRIVFHSNIKRAIAIALADSAVSFSDSLEKQAENLKDSIAIFLQNIYPDSIRYESAEYLEAKEDPWVSGSGLTPEQLGIPFSRRNVYHPQDLTDLQTYCEELQSFIAKVEQVMYQQSENDRLLAQKTDGILNQLRTGLEAIDDELFQIEYHQPRWYDRDQPSPSIDSNDWQRLRERTQVLQEDFFAACAFQNEERLLFDFLRLPLWRERWRIYELWMLTHLIQLFAHLGFTVDIHERISNACWDLKFTKDQLPIAILRIEQIQLEVYYQLYSKELDKGNMPDIAVKMKDSKFLIVLDPKHGTSYTKAGLVKTAKRYAQYFSPEITIIHNFYPIDSYEYEVIDEKPRCLVVSNICPGSTSVSRIDKEVTSLLLANNLIHKQSLVLLVDVSSSIYEVRERVVLSVKKEFQKLQNSNELSGSLILFNDRIIRDLHLSKVQSIDEVVDMFSGGTNLTFGIEAALEKLEGMPIPRMLLLFTDGQDTFDILSLGQRICLVGAQLKVYEIVSSYTKTSLQELSRITNGEYIQI